ncbi:relaxase/mobilization nuclease domain-containing protein [Enterobacter hormaechei]|uniref:Relaxase/mobilization nuclease domain-containing protein n=1 Tax=Salmonella enterica TaxID=28901 RepID=A0A758BEJ4_SALER|nr:relaxase/mobilization nuclease domain-containing protein [Enterobacter hormaechei]EBX2557388.1 relaxase [Salmonella enterica subsp. enterica serovar Nima]ECT9453781.1 relaxase [Salmonella enterica subsp. enterica serovar Oskarshamn]ECZ6078517.1 relaxase/mobilization nuclease domain-containing protein [Salmonella enterica]HBN1770430.1 relaxase/mobilization nuclease domain-containing protein [Escherichia coli]EDR5681448.1 relaxase/mobilization nuclease domain-containing protein [Salmonella en
MKGMQKIKRGKTFNGLISYLLKPASHHKSDPYVVGGNVIESFAEALSAEFNATKLLRSDVSKPVWHNSLRLPAGEQITTEQWKLLADDYMKRMGFSETHLRAYVLHDDKDGQHIHIVASRIDATSGKLYLGKNENLISTRIIQDLEKDYQLIRTKGTDALKPSTSPAKRKKSRNEAMMEKRTGELCPKTIIQNALEVFLADKPSTTEFVHQLNAQNIRAIPNIASTGSMNGFSFEYNGIAFKASQLGKSYSWTALQDKLDYQPERDNAFLFKLRASVSEAPCMFMTPDAPEITTAAVNSPIEALIHDNHNRAGQDEYTNASVKQLHLEAGAGAQEAFATEAVKEASKQSYMVSMFRWLETIPYLNTIITIFKNLKIPTLKRPLKYKTITDVRVIEITPLPKKNLIVSAPQSRRASLSM